MARKQPPLAIDLKHLLEEFPDPLMVVDPEGAVLWANGAAEASAPAGREVEVVWRGRAARLVLGSAGDHAAERARTAEARMARAEERERWADERVAHAEERERWAEERVQERAEGLRLATERSTRLERQLREAREQLKRCHQEIEQTDDRCRALEAERSGLHQRALELQAELDRSRQELAGHREEVETLQAALQEARDLVEVSREQIRDRDLTAELAYRDPLTGLPNRNLLRRYLEQIMAQQAGVAVLTLDLDHFKIVNNTAGSAAGDELLQQVARRLSQMLPKSDPLGRRGEDEFVVLMPRAGADAGLLQERAATLADRLLKELSKPFSVQGQRLSVRASLGISTCPGDAEGPDELLEHSDAAMVHAKEVNRGAFEFYTPDLRRRQERRLALEVQLRQAVAAREFSVDYQPIVDLFTGRTAGAEALVRWRHRMEGPLLPHVFLDIAEEAGLIVSIGRMVLEDVARQLSRWPMAEGFFVSVNLSARQLLQGDLLDSLSSLPSNRLMVELPEGRLGLDPDLVGVLMRSLRNAGVRVALDGFGTGSSALQHLDPRLAVLLKIDRALVEGVPSDPRKSALCLAAIATANTLGMVPLAVGVETREQVDFLRENRCRLGQGFFFSQAVEPEVFQDFLTHEGSWRF
ncbi:MAG: EAL domain-containing protein [Candidatus Eremiobacterota bacterium]